ncbi:MAG TPA: peptidyl-prolyl cis-trans isomerase [Bryobacteraceae bacterium]|nr:peptidyl-prolyl cis-trans isomerase [Bryobacteraceae bacterium]
MCAWTQTPDAGDPVVAVVNGRKITRSEYKKILEAQEGQLRALAEKQPKAFLEQFALYEGILAAAEKAGLDKQSPFKEKIGMARRQILVSGLIDARHAAFSVTPEQIQAHYDKNKDLFRQVMVRVVFVSAMMETRSLGDNTVTKAATPEEVRDKALKAAKLAREGADFAKIAKEYSDDPDSAAKGGEFPHPIRPNSNNVPQAIRTALFAAKAGDVVGPIPHETGFYVFKIETSGQASVDQVKEEIVRELKDASLKQWLDEFKKSSNVTVADEAQLTEAAKAK